jgi:hypothetical protein
LPIVACLVWFGARGALSHLYDTLFVFTPHYTALGWQNVTVLGMAYEGFSEWFITYSSVLTMGLLLLLALRPTTHEREGVAILLGVIAFHIVGVVMQAKFFPYHYGATWPPTGLLAALGWVKLWDRASARAGAVGAALTAVALVIVAFGRSATHDTPDNYIVRCAKRIAIYASSPRDQLALDGLATVADVNAAANRAVANLLRERVPDDRPVFVWGFEPVIYDLAERPAASRFLYDVPQRVEWAKDATRATLMRDLQNAPPAAIVVEHRDVFPMVTGSYLDSNDELPEFPALRDLLAERYEFFARIEDFDVFFLREVARAAPDGADAAEVTGR